MLATGRQLMRKARELIGMPVVLTQNRVEIERVEGFVLDLTETQVSALLVDSDDCRHQARILPLYEVRAFGESEIEVGSPSVIQRVDQIPDIRRILNVKTPVSGAHLVTDDGIDVGTVNDLLFDEHTGDIDSFEVSNDGPSDLSSEDEPLPLFDELDEEIIVHTSKVRQLEQAQPLSRLKVHESEMPCPPNRFGHHWQKSQALVRTPDAPLQHIMKRGLYDGWKRFKRLGQWLESKTLGFFHDLFLVVEKRRIERSLGRRILRSICGKDGKILCEKGDVVTPALVERARKANAIVELLNAAERSHDAPTNTNDKKIDQRGWMDGWWPPFI